MSDQIRKTREVIAEVHWTLRGTQDGGRGCISVRKTPSLSSFHEVFHVSMLRKYTPDPTHIVDWGELVVDADGTFKGGPVRIMDSQEQVLCGKIVRLVKVLWQHRGVEEATEEREDTVRTNYPFLVDREGVFSSH